jgi:hypothetical protein
VWTKVTCGQVTGGGFFGLFASGDGSTFTNVSVGDTDGSCFQANGPNELWTTIKCHGSSSGDAAAAEAPRASCGLPPGRT